MRLNWIFSRYAFMLASLAKLCSDSQYSLVLTSLRPPHVVLLLPLGYE